MANIDKIPQYILEAAAKKLGWDPASDPIQPYLDQLKNMPTKRIFDCYCEWKIGYSLRMWALWDVVEDLQKSEK